jgi:hypothetical protein
VGLRLGCGFSWRSGWWSLLLWVRDCRARPGDRCSSLGRRGGRGRCRLLGAALGGVSFKLEGRCGGEDGTLETAWKEGEIRGVCRRARTNRAFCRH